MNKRLTLVTCILASIVVFLDGSVVNVALPALRDDLDAGLATQQWVVEAYLLTLGSLILAGGSYADIHGRRHALMVGVVLFAVTSLACAVAPTGAVLVVARALQGVAGALLVPASLAVLTATYDDEEERGAAVGSWTAWTGVAFVVGPLAGGALVDTLSWRGVFAINLPLAAITFWLARRYVAESRDPEAAGSVDVPAAVLSMLFLGGAVLALIEQSERGWGDPFVLVPLLVAAVSLPAFLWREAHCSHPMLPLSLFRNRNFSAVNAVTLLVYGGLGALTFFLVIYLQQVAGYSATAAGAALVPITVIMFALSRHFGALSMRIGPRLPMTMGPIIAGLGLLWLRVIDGSADYATQVLPGLVVFGIGLSMTVAPLTATALSSVAQRHAGVASGVNNAVARVAGLVAIAAVGAVLASSFAAALDGRLSAGAVEQAQEQPLVLDVPRAVPSGQEARARTALRDASVDAFRDAMTVSGLLVLAGGLVAAVGLRKRPAPAPDPALA